MRAWGYLLVACVTLATACGARVAPVQSPTTLAAGGSLGQTEQVILDVLPKRSWTAENVQPGRVLAFLTVRSHLLRVEIRYDERQIGIHYVDSDNLAAHIGSDGQVYAHKNVNAWIRRLAVDIAAGLAAANANARAGAAGAAPGAAPIEGAGSVPPMNAPAAASPSAPATAPATPAPQ